VRQWNATGSGLDGYQIANGSRRPPAAAVRALPEGDAQTGRTVLRDYINNGSDSRRSAK
jgi:hypothetical protein